MLHIEEGHKIEQVWEEMWWRFLLGYSTSSKTYRVWNLASGTLKEVHDMEFDENNGSQE